MKTLSKKTVKLVLAMTLVIAIFVFILFAALPYLKGFLWAVVLFTIFLPVHKWLEKKTCMPRLSALLVIILSILLVLAPLAGILNLAYGELTRFREDQQTAQALTEKIEQLFNNEVGEIIVTAKQSVRELLEQNINTILAQASQTAIILIILFFTLFFLLIERKKARAAFIEMIPFNRRNSNRLIKEMDSVTKSTVMGMGLIALAQGLLVSIGFWIFGISGAVLWGFVAGILSFIPVIGPPLVWIPAGVIQIALGNMVGGVGILLWGGILVTNVDNVLRPYFSRKFANIHPLTTLVGVFIGVPIFGITGLIIGPLLIQYLFLTVRMFDQEYVRG